MKFQNGFSSYGMKPEKQKFQDWKYEVSEHVHLTLKRTHTQDNIEVI